jgi:ribulose 1,5-bisphosphate synthetase/thiazole synthase
MHPAPDVVIVSLCRLPLAFVLIVAVWARAGPAGLVVAIVLAQNGVSVRIIDKLSQPASGQRGSGVMVNNAAMILFLV